ncbi:MAG: hypothetical protein IPL35_12775 [Sphingobacteriales bacterium]|nr:hypothetical protein [Sphingobacteriales bacterium]
MKELENYQTQKDLAQVQQNAIAAGERAAELQQRSQSRIQGFIDRLFPTLQQKHANNVAKEIYSNELALSRQNNEHSRALLQQYLDSKLQAAAAELRHKLSLYELRQYEALRREVLEAIERCYTEFDDYFARTESIKNERNKERVLKTLESIADQSLNLLESKLNEMEAMVNKTLR